MIRSYHPLLRSGVALALLFLAGSPEAHAQRTARTKALFARAAAQTQVGPAVLVGAAGIGIDPETGTTEDWAFLFVDAEDGATPVLTFPVFGKTRAMVPGKIPVTGVDVEWVLDALEAQGYDLAAFGLENATSENLDALIEAIERVGLDDLEGVDWVGELENEGLDPAVVGALAGVAAAVPRLTALPDDWPDSDRAARVVEAAGGAAFRAAWPDVEVSAALLAVPDSLDLSLGGVSIDGLAGRPLWVFLYASAEALEYKIFAAEVESGLVIELEPSTFDAALAVAQASTSLGPDAVLVGAATSVPDLGVGDAASLWRIVLYAPSADQAQALYVGPGGVPLFSVDAMPASTEPLPASTIRPSEALGIALDARSDDGDDEAMPLGVAELGRGLLPSSPAAPVWRFLFAAPGLALDTVYVNAVTGELIEGAAAGVRAALATGNAGGLPEVFALEANYPNPFNPATTIRYRLAESGPMQLAVYDLLGRPVRVLAQGVQAAGVYEVAWDGHDAAGAEAASGVYLYRLRAGDQVLTRTMTLLR